MKKLVNSHSVQRAFCSNFIDVNEVMNLVELRVVREFNLPDTYASVLQVICLQIPYPKLDKRFRSQVSMLGKSVVIAVRLLSCGFSSCYTPRNSSSLTTFDANNFLNTLAFMQQKLQNTIKCFSYSEVMEQVGKCVFRFFALFRKG